MEITGKLIRKKLNGRGKLIITIKDKFGESKRIQVRKKNLTKVSVLNVDDMVSATYIKDNGNTILTHITNG